MLCLIPVGLLAVCRSTSHWTVIPACSAHLFICLFTKCGVYYVVETFFETQFVLLDKTVYICKDNFFYLDKRNGPIHIKRISLSRTILLLYVLALIPHDALPRRVTFQVVFAIKSRLLRTSLSTYFGQLLPSCFHMPGFFSGIPSFSSTTTVFWLLSYLHLLLSQFP